MSKTAIITGASSGIGKAFVKALLDSPECPDSIWIVARRLDKLEELAVFSSKVIPVQADLGSDAGMNTFLDKLKAEKPDVSLLVNCAGIGKRGNIADRPSSDISNVVQLNCITLSVLSREMIPYMNKGAAIINIASSAAFLPQPGFTVYAASKSYVVSFSRALSRELKKTGITVTAVCPGPVNTEFNRYATDGRTSEFTGFRRLIAADPDKLARASLKAASHKRRLFVYGFLQKVLHVASKLMPVGLFLDIVY